VKVIRALVDEEGNVQVDLAGFVGEECGPVEEEFRRYLAELGLSVRVRSLRKKDPRSLLPSFHPKEKGEHRAR
jgi:uncharacterized protein (DUF2252 family)